MELAKGYKWIVRALFAGCMAFSYLANSVDLASDHSVCRAMVNNVFLAYLPIELSFHVSGKRSSPVFWGLVAAWMLFYPNGSEVPSADRSLIYVKQH